MPGGVTVAGAPSVPAGLFPSNWITANPQFNAANFYTNSGKSNYHSHAGPRHAASDGRD